MTDQPEPNETAARMHADCCGCVRRGDLHRERFERWVQKVEAQAKREGAREALEKAAEIFDETAKQKQKLVWIPEAIAQQIRSLIEPTPVEPEVKSEVTLKLSDFTGESKQKMVEEIRASEKISGRDLRPEAAHRKAR